MSCQIRRRRPILSGLFQCVCLVAIWRVEWINLITTRRLNCILDAIAKASKKLAIVASRRQAAAIRFAGEELPSLLLLGAFIESDERRFGCKDIQALYESERYPLKKLMN